MRTRDEIVAAARGCLGARFRPHGRDPAFGLDCVGVAAIAFARPVEGRYPLRGGSAAAIGQTVAAAGLRPIDPEQAGAGQFHLAVLTGAGFVHADAGLRRVVEVPGMPAGRIVGAWTEEA